jgi:DNA-binding transcriptional regulator YiaG
MSLREAARFLDTNPTTVSRWESGRVTPRRAAAARYRKFLDSIEEAVVGSRD